MIWSSERITIVSSQWVIPLGDIFVEGMDSYYNFSIKANDFTISVKFLKVLHYAWSIWIFRG